MTNSASVVADLTAAGEMLDKGRFDSVLRLLIPLADASATRDRLLGAAYLGKRDLTRAFLHLHEALAKAPGQPQALFDLGRAHLAAADAFTAVGVFEGLITSTPDFPGLPAALASAYRRDARYADAIQTADAAMALNGVSVDLLYEKAVSQHALGDAKGALASHDALLAMDPEHAASWFVSHASALSVHGLDEAVARLHRAVACPGANGRYWASLCVYALLSGRLDEAQTIHAERIAKHPKRQALVDSVRALLPHLSPAHRLFGVSAELLRYALNEATMPGMVLEFGVRRGTSINHLAEIAGQTVHGFDSFEGLPEAWVNAPQGVLTTGTQLPPVRDNVVLHAGWFDDTLPAFLSHMPDAPLRFVNIDSDIYSSAKTVLTLLAGRMQPGTVLVFDEFIGNRNWRHDEFKAFEEFAAEHDAVFTYIALSPATKQVALRLTRIGGRS
ncbi:MAG TPA: class I SAM-dependent methyltransferase [Patescibacteria group bacterium]|nr:class I SAM-dependent methyltransferase [Patescibacteria group bacterium]